MFGFGRRKKDKRTLSVTNPSEAVNNVIFIMADNNPFFSVAVSLYKRDGTYLETIVSMFGNIVDEELREELDVLYNRLTNIEHETATRAVTVVIHPNIDEGLRIARAINDIPGKFYVKTFGDIVSNGRVWHDLVAGTTGNVDRESISNFQLDAILNDGNIQPYI